MAVIVGNEKKKQRRFERADVTNGLREQRIAADEKKAERKAAAEEEARQKEAAKAERRAGRPRKAAAQSAEPEVKNPEMPDAHE